MKINVPKDRAGSGRRRAPVHPRRRSVALSAVAVAILTPLAVSPAAATTTAAPATAFGGPAAAQLSAEDRAVMMEQAPYMELDEQVRRVASAQASSPLAGTRIDRADRTLYVYWAGVAPAELTRIQGSATRLGITMKIVPAAFSEQALMAATNDLSTVAESTRAELSITIHNDGSGLTVHQGDLPEVAQGRKVPTPVQSQILDAINAIRARSGIPITMAEQGPRPKADTRTDDRSPHWGGAITEDIGGSCTSGFSMYATGAPSTRFMMTAAHCTDFRDGVTVTNGVGVRMGVSDFIHELFDIGPSYDLGVIRLDGSNQGRVYSNETTSNGLYVKGLASGIPAGGTYCVSAAVATPNCRLLSGNQIVECQVPGASGRCIYYISWQSTTGAIVYCSGDSGGPVYYWTSAGIIAAAVVGIGYSPTDCDTYGGISVVSSATNRIPGLAVVTA